MLEGTCVIIGGIIILGLVVGAIVLTYVPAAVIKQRHRAQLEDQCKGTLVLTYDDGPGQLLTTRLLDLLRSFDARATFFLVGFRAQRFPESCRTMVDAGHELGCHTHWHRNCTRIWPWTAVKDINQGYESMGQWMSASAPFRPPFGKLITWTWLAIRRRAARLCLWTHDGGDTWPTLPDPTMIAEGILRGSGAVVLLHSHDRAADRHSYVLDLTRRLLEGARERRWRICTMAELIDASPANAVTAESGQVVHA